jgi:hypothetical protein
VKARTLVFIVCLMLTGFGANAASPAAAAAKEGTGVGNGGGSSRDAYLAKLRNEFAVNRTQMGDDAELFSQWCSRVSSILLREKRRAMLQYQYGHNSQADQILNDALVSAAQSISVDARAGGPMTKKLIDRALMDSAALDDAVPGDTGLAIATKLNFLFGAVDFIIDVSGTLDPEFYIPYRYRHHGCYGDCSPAFDFAGFEAAFARAAARQLTFATDTLTETLSGGNGRVYPVGSPKAFLKVAELTAGFVAYDLKQNLHAYAFSCAIRDLEELSDELSAYNLSGDRTYFPNDPWAVSYAAQRMRQISAQITNRTGCVRY